MLSSKIIKKITACCCMAAVMLAASGCSDSKSYVSNSNEPKELKITYVKSPLNIPSIIDKNLQTVSKEFAKLILKFLILKSIPVPNKLEALAAGSLDICSALGGTSAILAASNGVDLKIVGIYSRAPKAFTIMAKDPNITTVSDLTGKKVAGPKGTILHQILVAALAKKQSKAR
ncbi:MAG: ABC transporter substrate-binding protein [Phascolarctobacterium faecium]